MRCVCSEKTSFPATPRVKVPPALAISAPVLLALAVPLPQFDGDQNTHQLTNGASLHLLHCVWLC